MKLGFPTNMRVHKSFRRKVKVGDIFTYQMPDELFRFGRVIRDDALIGGFDGVTIFLLYFYNVAARTKTPIPPLGPDDLLIPPVLSKRSGWLDGLFETVDHRELSEGDLLPVHCFEEIWPKREIPRYYDEYRNRLAKKFEPCGHRALTGIGVIDDELSAALGFPVIPHEQKIKVAKRPRKPRVSWKRKRE